MSIADIALAARTDYHSVWRAVLRGQLRAERTEGGRWRVEGPRARGWIREQEYQRETERQVRAARAAALETAGGAGKENL